MNLDYILVKTMFYLGMSIFVMLYVGWLVNKFDTNKKRSFVTLVIFTTIIVVVYSIKLLGMITLGLIISALSMAISAVTMFLNLFFPKILNKYSNSDAVILIAVFIMMFVGMLFLVIGARVTNITEYNQIISQINS